LLYLLVDDGGRLIKQCRYILFELY